MPLKDFLEFSKLITTLCEPSIHLYTDWSSGFQSMDHLCTGYISLHDVSKYVFVIEKVHYKIIRAHGLFVFEGQYECIKDDTATENNEKLGNFATISL